MNIPKRPDIKPPGNQTSKIKHVYFIPRTKIDATHSFMRMIALTCDGRLFEKIEGVDGDWTDWHEIDPVQEKQP